MYGVNSDFEQRSVAIYARVSTDHEAQLSALENQIDWYKPILASRPNWPLTAQYIDEGITGTSAKKRPQFMKMIKDAIVLNPFTKQFIFKRDMFEAMKNSKSRIVD